MIVRDSQLGSTCAARPPARSPGLSERTPPAAGGRALRQQTYFLTAPTLSETRPRRSEQTLSGNGTSLDRV